MPRLTRTDLAFEVTKIPAGARCLVSASSDGYAPRMLGYEAFSESGFKSFDDIQLVKAAKLTGTVSDASGKPIQGVKVRPTPMAIDGRGYVSPHRAEVETDEQGKFVLTDLP